MWTDALQGSSALLGCSHKLLQIFVANPRTTAPPPLHKIIYRRISLMRHFYIYISGMKIFLRPFLFAFFAFTATFFAGCSGDAPEYVIGVSQCSEDSWRLKLRDEMIQATYFNEGVTLRMTFADDDDVQQSRQIDSLLDSGIDILIVSPNQVKGLSGSINRARQMNIPVILFDRKAGNEDYTAFMGADNYAIGQLLAEYVAAQLKGNGNIIEIGGLKGSSPARERHLGFAETIKKYPGLKIVGFAEGDWKEESGKVAMTEILERYDGEIDCIFGANDRMALGAKQAMDNLRPKNNHIIYIGVDALPTAGGGIEKVRDGDLTASAIYPTHGDEVIELALKILRGEPYEKEKMMETSLVTAENAKVLLLQYKEIEKMDRYIGKMHNRVSTILDKLEFRNVISIISCLFTVIVAIFLALIIRAYRIKGRLIAELNAEKALSEQQRDQIEEQKDQILDAGEPNDAIPEEIPANDTQKNEFLEKFLDCINKKLSNPDLSVEEIGMELGVSRVQLYRKIKNMAQKSPVEIIREQRLLQGKELLKDSSLSVSEVAFRVGFNAHSYFTKCYKDFFGKPPRSN